MKKKSSICPAASWQTLACGAAELQIAASIKKLESGRFIERLWNRDASLWSSDEEIQGLIKNRLGWLRIAEVMAGETEKIKGFAREVRSQGLTHAVLLGMGGSSLFSEVCRKTFGLSPGQLDLQVLDTTDPTAIRLSRQRCPLSRLFTIISSKSGATSEVAALSKYFYHAYKSAGVDPARHCAVITDTGTPLEDQAKEWGLRNIFVHGPENGKDVGGRFSALTYFGLVPASLLGLDIDLLLKRAIEMLAACRRDSSTQDNAAIKLGAVLGASVLSGHGKMMLLCASNLESFGTWVEQLVAESLGKLGKGMTPIHGDMLRRPCDYSSDRVIVELQLAEKRDRSLSAHVDAMAEAGHPLVRIVWRDLYDLGSEVAKWAVATAVAGHLMELNPFDEPNVKESKERTKELLAHYTKEGRLYEDGMVCQDGQICIYGSVTCDQSASLKELLDAFFKQARSSDYIALLSFLPRSRALDKSVRMFRECLAQKLERDTMLGFGPRYLHSTGQLYKGGPDAGLFILLTANEEEDLPIPTAPFTFGILKQAQALGDFQAMRKRNRRILRLHVGKDPEWDIQRIITSLDAGRAGSHGSLA